MKKEKFKFLKTKRFKVILIVILILIAATAWYEIPVTEYVTISSGGKVTNPVRFALVTDLHSELYGADQSELIDRIDRENVDAVLLSGDIVDDRFKDTTARIFIDKIAAKYPCYYVSGNHEFWSGRIGVIKDFMTAAGVTVLEGAASQLEIGGTTVDICGVDDPTYMTPEEFLSQLDTALAESDENHFRILLSHRPEKVDIYANYDFDLVLCGHAHGGQWKIPFTQIGVHAPNQGLFPRFVDGVYELSNGSKMVVSRGLARLRQPYPRFFNHPEVVIIDITE